MSRRVVLLVVAAAVAASAAAAFLLTTRDPSPPPLGKDVHGDPLPPFAVARIGSMRLRAGFEVALREGGREVVTAGPEVRVYQVGTGALLRSFRVREPRRVRARQDGFFAELFSDSQDSMDIWSISLSRDGRRLLACIDDVNELWDVDTGKLLQKWPNPLGHVRALLSDDGRRAAWLGLPPGTDLATGPFALDVRDLETGECLRTWPVTRLYSLAFVPGAEAVAASFPTRIYDIVTGEVREFDSPTVPRALGGGVAVSADGVLVASNDIPELVVHDISTGTELLRRAGGQRWGGIDFSPRSRTLATGGELLVFGSGEPSIRRLPEDARTPRFSTDGSRLALVRGGQVVVLDAQTLEALTPDLPPIGTDAFAWSPDGGRIATVGPDGAHVWDAETGRMLSEHPRLPRSDRIGWSRDGRRFAVRGQDGAAAVVHVGTGRVDVVATPSRDWALERPPSPGITAGDLVGWPEKVRGIVLRDLTTGVERALDGSAGHVAPSLSAAGNRLLALGTQGGIRVWDLPLGTPVLDVAEAANHAVLSPRGRFLAGYRGGPLWVADGSTGRRVLELEVAAGSSDTPPMAVSDDGLLAWAASYWSVLGENAPEIQLWSTSSGRRVGSLGTHGSHAAGVADLAFSPDGTRLASASSDGTILVWDVTPWLR